ncbi:MULTISPECIES: hypothetical protein [unclassified Methylobacterium]|jgi:hypothetical protein|uniref:hypothetical protein n=1 Tax=unclassified Methylobacterium TaxID=2615210 RepID=UPI0008E4EFD9|nr:hypothetical protein [Methylobacterium sp. yr596]SFF59991.1 hypothetical protein SAMN04487844_13056 [Methylobacterium sp. yr596]
MRETPLWSVTLEGGVFGRLRRVELLESLPPEGTVVDTRGGHAVVRDGVLVAVSEQQAEDLVDPAGAAQRRYRAACLAAGWTDRLKRIVTAPGDEWEAGTAYPTGDGALVYCERVRGRHVWVRRATYAEAVALGVTA